MKGKPVVIRTLDIGADKVLNEAARETLGMGRGAPRPESNPALGLRAIRYCLAYPELFLTQLRAILRASEVGTVRILVPMLAHMHEVEQALAFVAQAKHSCATKSASTMAACKSAEWSKCPRRRFQCRNWSRS